MTQQISLPEEYYNKYDIYKEKYGKIALLTQSGSFYNMYSPLDFSRGNAAELAKVKYIELTKKKAGYYMPGFPTYRLEDKFLKILLDNDYTVIIEDQFENTTDPLNNRMARVVTRVVSKGTYESTNLRNNIMSIYIYQYSKNYVSFGISVIDTNLSDTINVHEIHSLPNDYNIALDTAIKLVLQYNPVECIIVTKNESKLPDIIKHLPLNCPIYRRDIQVAQNFTDEDENENENDDYSEYIMYSLNVLKSFLRDHFINVSNLKIVNSNTFKDSMDLCSNSVKQLDLFLFYERKDINLT